MENSGEIPSISVKLQTAKCLLRFPSPYGKAELLNGHAWLKENEVAGARALQLLRRL